MENIPSLSEIKAKSRELQIPYESLLSVFILERAATAVSKSEAAKSFWLKNDLVFDPEIYGGKPPLRLDYIFCDKEELLIQSINDIFQSGEEKGFWKISRIEEEKDQVHVYLTAKIEELQVPAEFVVSRLFDDTLRPREKERESFFQENPKIKYLYYPVEGLLAEHFVRILRDLEFLTDLGSYDIVYYLLKHEMNSTRRVTEQIEILVKQYHIPVEKERFEMVCACRDSSYMKKKWKSYLKREKKKTPSFEEVMNVLTAYFKPVWNALEEGGYYLGDWMPELERFLD